MEPERATATIVMLAFSFLAGGVLALICLFALRRTIAGIGRAARPGLYMTAMMLLRFVFVISAFYVLIAYAGWQHGIAALAGFILARMLALRRLGPTV